MTISQEINTPRASDSTAGGGLCLNMIVKNEVKILERCLLSVAPWISYYVIGDTGSTDGTQDLIRSFFKERGIEGEIHEYEFEDYSQARNLALEFCKASTGKFNNILLIDADMELKVDDPNALFPGRLPPVGTVRQTNSELSYSNVRLLNRAVESKYLEPTHEYISSPFTALPVEGIWFYDHANGSNRGEKSARDARLLEASILKNPNNVRSMFYLAQTYKDMGEWAKALAWYTKRKEAGGWDEEVWYAAYMMANCYKAACGGANLKAGQADEYEARFIAQCLEAYQLRPSRAEPLHVLANYYRNKGKNELALIISEAGKKVPYPNDKLFVEDGVYRHGFDEEIGISGFYAQSRERKEDGHRACMQLTTSREAPEHVRRNAIENSGFYAKSAKELFPSFEANQIPFECSEGYVAMNPSVVVDGDDVHCIVRTVNYTMDEAQRYHMPSDNIIRTTNYHLRWDEFAGRVKSKHNVSSTGKKSPKISLTAGDTARAGLFLLSEPSSQEEILELADPQGLNDFPVKGYEDCRLFKWRKDWWCSATVRDRHPQGQCEIVLFNQRTKREHVIRNFDNSRHQKNWVPLVTQFDQLLFIYSADPTIILEIDPQTLACKKKTESEPAFNLSNLRGSSQAITSTCGGANLKTPGGWIYVAHEVAGRVPGGRSRYLHRFVELDNTFQVRHVSQSFYFIGQGIEFCAGIARKGNNLLISFGFEDRQAFIATVKESEIHEFLATSQVQGNVTT